MILSELVDYLNQLDSIAVNDLHADAREGLESALYTITNHKSINWPKMYKGAAENLRQLDRLYQDFTHNINTLRSHARHLIAEQENEYYQASTRLWQNEMVYETNQYQLDRVLNSSAWNDEQILGRVLRWSDWRYPGMVIGPKRSTWIDNLVGLDPLYLVDQHLELLQPAQQRYHPAYQNRLRLYAVSERNHQPILTALPDRQFSLVFAYDFFHYRPFELLCKWSSEVFQKLRPGGVFFFTFNDCDFAQGVALTERNYMCYTPGHQVVQHLRDTGFERIECHRGEADLGWIEAYRPGALDTMRAGQNLAKILA